MVLRLNRTGNPINRNERNNINENWDNIERDFNNVVNVISDTAYQRVVDSARLTWQVPVSSFGQLSTTYPNALNSWTAQTLDDGKVYRYDGSNWINIQTVDAGPLNAIDTRLNDKIDARTSITPEDFIGTDFQKLQQALDFAVLNNVGLRIQKEYNITGNTLIINKPNVYQSSNRRATYITGGGGRIIKNDSGYFFDVPGVDVGEIYFEKVQFFGTVGTNSTVFNGNRIINLYVDDCQFFNVDHVMEANNRYGQGWHFSGCLIDGGNGWAFEFLYGFAINIDDCTIERRDSAIRNTGPADNSNAQINITRNTIEGLRGKALELNGGFAINIDGNYMELNQGGYIEIKSLCNSLVLKSNFLELSQEQRDANIAAIKTSVGTYNSEGNRTNGILYNNVTDATIYSVADQAVSIANAGENSIYRQTSNGSSVVGGTYGVTKKYGTDTLYVNRQTTLIPATSTASVDVNLNGNIFDDDVIIARVRSTSFEQSIQLLSYYRLNSTTVRCIVNNLHPTSDLTVTITVNALRIGNTSFYG